MVVSEMLPVQGNLDVQHCVAKALYDNIAESPDELAFRKGDVLSVLEQNTGGIEGWWLCCLRGRQGICPGNRLRILPGVYEVTDADLPLQNLSKRRSWHVQPNMVLRPQKYGDIYLYDLPPGQAIPCNPGGHDGSLLEAYDVPRSISHESNHMLASPTSREELQQQSYDTPRPLGAPLTPSSSASSLTAPESMSLPSSNRSSLMSGPEYDVPRPRMLTPQIYDVPAGNPKPKELPLELSSALETLNRLQTEAGSAVQRLLALVTPTWRDPETLMTTALEIKLIALRLRIALHELAEFCEGALGNAQRAPDAGLGPKLTPLAKALVDADRVVQEACSHLDSLDWAVGALSRDDNDTSVDYLERLVSIARSLTEDVRRAASFLQGNAPLLFRKDSLRKSHPEDYDYVSVDGIGEALPSDLKPAYDMALHDMALHDSSESDDVRLLKFYSALAGNHISHLTEAIDAFLNTVEHNQPPKIFLAHGKLVVLSAHRLVHVGDTVARNIAQTHIKQRVQEQADSLSQALDQTVQRTKRAAQHFPSVAAVQDMVDAVVDVSHFASDLRRSLVYA